MPSIIPDQNSPASPQQYSFEWKGGFSYLTYLKVVNDVSISDGVLSLSTKRFIFGAFPMRGTTVNIPLHHIKGLSVGSQLNGFDLMFAILFALVTFISMSFWPLLLTALFLWRTFNTCVCITDLHSSKTRILTKSKAAATGFVQTLSETINQQMKEGTEAFTSIPPSNPLQLIVTTQEKNPAKKGVIVTITAVAALAILFIAIQSRNSSNSDYVNWVRNGTVTGTSLTMSQVLENKAYFSNVEWKEVKEEGNDLDKFVMYQATLSDQGVKVGVRTIFQVFGENHFEAVEASSDGEVLHTSDWYVFLADMAGQYNNKATSEKSVQTNQQPKQTAAAIQATSTPSVTHDNEASRVASVASERMNLKSFVQWLPSSSDAALPVKLDGERMTLRIGPDTPNGVKIQVVSDSLKKGWSLQLKNTGGSGSPFDGSGDLRQGFTLYIKDYNFDQELTPEIVIAASDGSTETYVWVFAFNHLYGEAGDAPLQQIWFGEGQNDVELVKNRILLPYGSQGLSDSYVFDNGTFRKEK